MKIYYFKDYKNMEVKNWRQYKKNFYGKKHLNKSKINIKIQFAVMHQPIKLKHGN